MKTVCCDFEFQAIVPATSLEEIWDVFEPTLSIDPASDFYIQRTDPKLQMLTFDLKRIKGDLHAFLCGHRGSGKTTELKPNRTVRRVTGITDTPKNPVTMPSELPGFGCNQTMRPRIA